MVGFRLVDRLSDDGGAARFAVTVFGEEPRPAYDRVHLGDGFRGCPGSALELAPRSWYAERGVELFAADPVNELDLERRRVRTRSGRERAWDRLFLATGAAPMVPPPLSAALDGRFADRVFTYRTLEDFERISARARRSRRAAIIGGGLLGLELARALIDGGLTVDVIEAAPSLLVRQLSANAAGCLQRGLEELGARVRLAARTEALEPAPAGGGVTLRFDDGSRLETDLVVVAAGIRPRDELARAAGLPCGLRGGIEVNRRLETPRPGVYALGECALVEGQFYGFVAPGYRMVDVVTRNLRGDHVEFEPPAPFTRLKVPGIEVNTVGEPRSPGRTLTYCERGVYRQVVLERGRLLGACAVGPWAELGRVKEAFACGRALGRRALARFERTGSLWSTPGDDPETWPPGNVVCECMGVTLGELLGARERGNREPASLAHATGASTVCGSCRPVLARLTGAPSPAPRRDRVVLTASAAAIALTAVTVLAPRLPFRASEPTGFSLDLLWRDALLKQVSGWTLGGLCLASLLLSARKRLRWVSLGSYAGWRRVHVCVGGATLAGLAAHTGLRLGANVNLALTIVFVGLAALGGAAGLLTGSDWGLSPLRAARLRSLATRAHVFLLWPLIALLVFHVLAVYYF